MDMSMCMHGRGHGGICMVMTNDHVYKYGHEHGHKHGHERGYEHKYGHEHGHENENENENENEKVNGHEHDMTLK